MGEMNGNNGTIPTEFDTIPAEFKYNMMHAERGIAMIFNHKDFANPREFGRRDGTDVDCQRLVTTLTRLGFVVHVYQDQQLGDILHRIKIVSETDFTDHDCILVAILTHGREDLYVAAHDSEYRLASIFNYLKDDQCPTLKGKPKLFFIQACQGARVDPGIELELNFRANANPHHQEPEFILKNGFIGCYNVIVPPDFLIAYSTMPGFYSWRNNTNGSWFIQTLCDELDRNGTKEHLVSLLTSVRRTVATEYCELSTVMQII